MPQRRNRFNLPIALVQNLDLIGEQFEVGPTELLRIGSLDVMKMQPMGGDPGLREPLDICWPEALRNRISAQANRTGCSLELMVETILWATVRSFPNQFPAPLRDNPAGLNVVKKKVESNGWW